MAHFFIELIFMTSVLYFEMPISKVWLSKMQENKTPKKEKKRRKKNPSHSPQELTSLKSLKFPCIKHRIWPEFCWVTVLEWHSILMLGIRNTVFDRDPCVCLLAVHGARQEEVIDHRLTDREWAEEWKHLDNVRISMVAVFNVHRFFVSMRQHPKAAQKRKREPKFVLVLRMMSRWQAEQPPSHLSKQLTDSWP